MAAAQLEAGQDLLRPHRALHGRPDEGQDDRGEGLTGS